MALWGSPRRAHRRRKASVVRLEAQGRGHRLAPARLACPQKVLLAEEEEARPRRMRPEEKQVLPGPAPQLWPL